MDSQILFLHMDRKAFSNRVRRTYNIRRFLQTQRQCASNDVTC